MWKSALLLTAGVIVGAAAVQSIHVSAATGSGVYTVFEAAVTDQAAYEKALPDVQKILKENGGAYVAGGFNKAKLLDGKQAVGNRYVILHWDSEEAVTKAQNGGVKAWIEKNAPDARQVIVETVEPGK